MYSDAGRPKKSREDKQRELFLQKRSRKGLNKGKEMELQSGFRFRDFPKPPSLYHLLQGDFLIQTLRFYLIKRFRCSEQGNLLRGIDNKTFGR